MLSGCLSREAFQRDQKVKKFVIYMKNKKYSWVSLAVSERRLNFPFSAIVNQERLKLALLPNEISSISDENANILKSKKMKRKSNGFVFLKNSIEKVKDFLALERNIQVLVFSGVLATVGFSGLPSYPSILRRLEPPWSR